MTITELKYVVALAKEEHFGKAASRVFVSQPTLSIGIKKLEEELDVQLFERLPNKVIPTQIGLRIIEAAHKTLMSADTIRSIADEAKGELTGDIKLGAIYTICPYLLPRIIPDLQQHAPKMHLYIKEGYTNHLIELLKAGELDLAVISLPTKESCLLNIRPIVEENFYVILPKKHALCRRSVIDIADLADEQIFMLGKGNCLRDQVLQQCYSSFIQNTEQSKSIEGGSLETIRMMVASGLGISIFPQMAVAKTDNVIAKPFISPAPKRQIALAWRKSFTQQAIVDVIENSIKRCQPRFNQSG